MKKNLASIVCYAGTLLALGDSAYPLRADAQAPSNPCDYRNRITNPFLGITSLSDSQESVTSDYILKCVANTRSFFLLNDAAAKKRAKSLTARIVTMDLVSNLGIAFGAAGATAGALTESKSKTGWTIGPAAIALIAVANKVFITPGVRRQAEACDKLDLYNENINQLDTWERNSASSDTQLKFLSEYKAFIASALDITKACGVTGILIKE